ncbi:hypothetical protein KI387_032913 [Taxus chinensis]|uniref:non-specific serine/threonine protein kinase n=1 Tax=Taxus chinensis TaxID=29808 RepID=A0AA38BWQ8_TAXCH|nr:hypothetical protein KI387_032913 [Taxus chinensis]
MPNGSLHKHLHRNSADGKDEQELSLRKRWEIMYQVARGVSYLHDDCRPTIVHCDLKPQNVLLDETLTARVADFGITGRKGIHLFFVFVFVNAEYGMGGRISTKGDVYSYGMLVLETLTEKSPTDSMFSSGLTLSSWVSDSFPNQLRDVVAPGLGEEIGPTSNNGFSIHQGLAQVGLHCTSQLSHQRPTMAEVLNMLKHYQAKEKEQYRISQPNWNNWTKLRNNKP